jgi:fatty acid desaturase
MTSATMSAARAATGPAAGAAVPAGRGTDFAELARRVRSAGLLTPRAGHYTARIAITALGYLAGWTGVILLGESWYQLLVAVFLAGVFTQIGFLGHEAGHGQVARSTRASRVLGLIHGNAAIGLSYGWWMNKHTRHHAHPNDIEKDPDVGSGALVFTAGQARLRRGLAAAWTRSQAYLFFPLLLLEGLHLHTASIGYLLRSRRTGRWLELGLLAAHLGGYATVVFLAMSPLQALAFIAVQQGLFGLYMGCSFAPNHKGMAVLGPQASADFLRRQVLTSRNIRGGPVIDIVFGGLNYQIEHHLFPSLPRPNLRVVSVLVRDFCAERGVAYRETGMVASYREVLRHLHSVGEPLRRRAAAGR